MPHFTFVPARSEYDVMMDVPHNYIETVSPDWQGAITAAAAAPASETVGPPWVQYDLTAVPPFSPVGI